VTDVRWPRPLFVGAAAVLRCCTAESSTRNRDRRPGPLRRLGGGMRQLRCDFTRLNARGPSGAKFYLSEMALTALPLLRRLRPSERDDLVDLVAPDEDEAFTYEEPE
jgi:hypothetical protein